MKLYFGASLILVCLVGLSGCGGQSSTPREVSPADDHSCDFGSDAGEAMLPYRSSIQQTLFEKKFDFGYLNSVLKASATQTAQFVQQQLGTQVYSAETKIKGKCGFFSFLSGPPQDLNTYFQSLTSGSETSFVAGVFFSKQTADLPSTNSSPAILVMKTGDRWTLVHEMLHDVFEKYELDQGKESRELLQDRLLSEKQVLKSARTSGPLYLDQLAKYEEDFYEFLVGYPLEEVTIEELLAHLYATGELAYAPYSEHSTPMYIQKSLERADHWLSAHEQEFTLKAASSRASGNSSARETQAHARLARLQSTVQDMLRRLDQSTVKMGQLKILKRNQTSSDAMTKAPTILDAHIQRMFDFGDRLTR